jgi:peptidoglycan/xylan/chitin deacetylase (PgdA/CDA1 family)
MTSPFIVQAQGPIMSSCPAVPFAQPRADLDDLSLAAKLSGKLSRFLARNLGTKTLVMRNAQPMVTFTFDDVPATACHVGALIIEQYGVRGTYYVSGGGCGAPSPCGQLATVDLLRVLFARGHEIGCHTYSHAAVASISARELATDTERNHLFLKGVSDGIGVRNFAYPYGDLSFRTKRYLEGRFDSCRSLLPGINTGTIDLGALKTLALENASIDRPRILDLVAETVKTNNWLVFNSHDVQEVPSRFGVSPDLLAFAAATAKDAGCRPVTIAEGLRLAGGGKNE